MSAGVGDASPGLVLRADADATQGAGHAIRSLALAQAWLAAGGRATLVTRSRARTILAAYETAGVSIRPLAAEAGTDDDAVDTARIARETGARWISVDGYHLGSAYRRILTAGAVPRQLIFDDAADGPVPDAALVIGVARDASDTSPSTSLLAGARFGLLRGEFDTFDSWHRTTRQQVTRVLVSLGGGAPATAARLVLDALARCLGPDAETVVLAGLFDGDDTALDALAACHDGVVRVERGLDVARWMAWADLAVAAAGSTGFELAFMRLPAVLFSLAPNQRPVARRLASAGVAVDAGRLADLDGPALAASVAALAREPARRRGMAEAGRAVCDGGGPRRIIMRMREEPLWLRRAHAGDAHRVWKWRNDPTSRARSFSGQLIPLDAHRAWFAERLADTATLLFIGQDYLDRPVGQVRFDRTAETVARVSVNVAPSCRGRGFGRWLIAIGSRTAVRQWGVREVVAEIRDDNVASIRAFAWAGYRERGAARPGARRLVFGRADGAPARRDGAGGR